MDQNNPYFMEERRKLIQSIIQKEKRVTISELSRRFDIGEATIRRDLNAMEKSGLIQKTHGGAILADRAYKEVAINIRDEQNKEEKERIALAAASLVYDSEAIMIDAGSTTYKIAQQLKGKSELVVVTNSPLVSSELAGVGNNKIILTGGELNADTNALIGPVATGAVRQFRVDKVFIGASGLLLEDGFFTVSPYEAEIKRAMMEMAAEITIVMDSSKIGTSMFSRICSTREIDRLIVDSGINDEVLMELKQCGIEVLTV